MNFKGERLTRRSFLHSRSAKIHPKNFTPSSWRSSVKWRAPLMKKLNDSSIDSKSSFSETKEPGSTLRMAIFAKKDNHFTTLKASTFSKIKSCCSESILPKTATSFAPTSRKTSVRSTCRTSSWFSLTSTLPCRLSEGTSDKAWLKTRPN